MKGWVNGPLDLYHFHVTVSEETRSIHIVKEKKTHYLISLILSATTLNLTFLRTSVSANWRSAIPYFTILIFFLSDLKNNNNNNSWTNRGPPRVVECTKQWWTRITTENSGSLGLQKVDYYNNFFLGIVWTWAIIP